jgi:DNA polymerase (family 10)
MDNYQIADHFSLLSKLMDIHGENSFKAKSYSIAAFNIEKLPVQLATLSADEIYAMKGIGEAIGKKIEELLKTGQLQVLNDIISKTPPGIIEMLQINGLGPKKIQTIWKELGIESIGELLYACQENRLLMYKGFGEKTQEKVKNAIEFFLKSKGHFLYAETESFIQAIQDKLNTQFKDHRTEVCGEFRRQCEIITQPAWVTSIPKQQLTDFFSANGFQIIKEEESSILLASPENIQLSFQLTVTDCFGTTLFHHSASEEFLRYWKEKIGDIPSVSSEENIFSAAGISFIPPAYREKTTAIDKALNHQLPAFIQPADIKGIIHSHSKWSDGLYDLNEMATACIKRGLEYLVISDHSKSAFYANGLTEDRIKAQHQLIDELNEKLKPFKIFKSIECDILSDGSLDYADHILSTFDLVITSIHSNLSMSLDKAMMRLMKAIENPYTNILGHMTGRLLLSRNGYPVDHEKIIEACKKNNVVIELNAHPRRLDIDWRWIEKAINADVLISINPDAHSIEGFDDIRYGVLAAQKGGLTKEKNLSSFDLASFEQFIATQKKH